MAYMNQEKKQKIAAALKVALKGVGIKYTLGVNNHSTLVVNIKSGDIDFIGNSRSVERNDAANSTRDYLDVNPYWIRERFTGKALDALTKIMETIKSAGNWYDNSDSQIDYFDTAFYVNIKIGQWNKPYELV